MDTIAKSQDGGVSNTAVTTYTGDGTLLRVNLGFYPRYVQLVNLTDQTTYEWYFGMAAGTTLKTVAAGTRTLNTADVAISPKSGQDAFRGFEVPAAVNINAKAFAVIAHG